MNGYDMNPTRERNFLSYYNISGNIPVSEAEVICITDIPNSLMNRFYNVELINYLYQNHLILVERTPCEQEIQAFDNVLTNGLRASKIKGWDNPELQQKLGVLEKRMRIIQKLMDEIKVKSDQGCWGEFLVGHGAFEKLMAFAPLKVQSQKKEIHKILMDGNLFIFSECVRLVIQEVFTEHQRLLAKLYTSTFQARQMYLQEGIEKGIFSYGKVIVLVVGSLILQNPRLQGDVYSTKPIHDYLKTKKHVIINAKDSFIPLLDQPHLWPKAFFYQPPQIS